MLVQPAVPASLRLLRQTVAEWLAAANWPDTEVEDIKLAVSEAVANVIDHAYLDHDPGPVHLHAWIAQPADQALPPAALVAITPPGAALPASLETGSARHGRTATMVVSDRGRWTPERRTVDPNGNRGHGLAVMTGLMAAVHIQHGSGGTTVVLVSTPVPVPA
jgi:anti-sigma regulatory factor (Ser/Thr protein kinase)